MTGVAEGNPNWGANGPYNDWYYTAIPNDTPEAWVLDSAYSSPAEVAASGGVLPAALGGYLLVPGQ